MSESVALNTRAVPGLGSQSVVADVRIPRGIVDIDRACECFVAQGGGESRDTWIPNLNEWKLRVSRLSQLSQFLNCRYGLT